MREVVVRIIAFKKKKKKNCCKKSHNFTSETAAGKELGRELTIQMRKFQAEMKALQEQMNAAIKVKDEETRMELEEECARVREQMMKAQMDADKLLSNFKESNAKMEQRLKGMEAEHERQHANLKSQLATATNRAQQDAIAARLEELLGDGFFSHLGRALDSGARSVANVNISQITSNCTKKSVTDIRKEEVRQV
ncbi:hypothetical protein PILCRDRAFT_90359 [Piloderma croceum F 1598]|uniref:Uncharacterized protein n=1 Tax=Piloderma croceum (strain F 1598) TaxID=765440 RepID=A0A0C3FGU1_PILCF|nr:hypothetical protein PILCRDRAFT_90359 [Piloderma croceum F 1598]